MQNENPRRTFLLKQVQELLRIQALAKNRPERMKWAIDIFNLLVEYIDVYEELRITRPKFPETTRRKLVELYYTASQTLQERDMYLRYMDHLCPNDAQLLRALQL